MLEITGKGVLGMRGGWENEIKIGVKINTVVPSCNIVNVGAVEEKIHTRVVRRSPHHQSSLREKGWRIRGWWKWGREQNQFNLTVKVWRLGRPSSCAEALGVLLGDVIFFLPSVSPLLGPLGFFISHRFQKINKFSGPPGKGPRRSCGAN